MPKQPIPNSLQNYKVAQDYVVPIEVHTHFMGAVPLEQLIEFVEKNGLKAGTAADAATPADVISGEAKKLLDKVPSQLEKTEFGLYILTSLALVEDYQKIADKERQDPDENRWGAYYPLTVSLIAGLWMLHYLFKKSGFAADEFPYLNDKGQKVLREFQLIQLDAQQGTTEEFNETCYKFDNFFTLYRTLIDKIKRFFVVERTSIASAIKPFCRIARIALEAMFMASKCSPFDGAYETRDYFAKFYGYKAYSEITVDFLVKEEEIRYAEQANSLPKLEKKFTEAGWKKWINEFTTNNPTQGDGKPLIDIRWLITVQSQQFFCKKVIDNDTLGKIKIALARKDVIGVDVAQPELKFDPSTAKKSFELLYKAILHVAKAENKRLVFRPHVGEGSGLPQGAEPLLRRFSREKEINKFFFQVDFILWFNQDILVKTAEEKQPASGSTLEPGLDLFRQMLIVLCPEHFRIAKGFSEAAWWGERPQKVKDTGAELAKDHVDKALKDRQTPKEDAEKKKENDAYRELWTNRPLSKVAVENFARDNMTILLDALVELEGGGEEKKWRDDNYVIVRFGHATHADEQVIKRMKQLNVHSEANIGSNGRTGSIQFVGPDREKYLDQWWNYDPNQLGHHPVWQFVANDISTILSTDGQGVENTRLRFEYCAALSNYKKHTTDVKNIDGSITTEKTFLNRIQKQAKDYWKYILSPPGTVATDSGGSIVPVGRSGDRIVLPSAPEASQEAREDVTTIFQYTFPPRTGKE